MALHFELDRFFAAAAAEASNGLFVSFEMCFLCHFAIGINHTC